jgi:hypothetical protein
MMFIIVFVFCLDQARLTGSSYMRRKHHRLCMLFRPNLASPGAATCDESIIVFACGLDQTTQPHFTGSSFMRRKHHRLFGLSHKDDDVDI